MVVPSGLATTGWPAVRDKCSSFGVEFDPWQDGAGRIILSKRTDGLYATSIGGCVISIPRQVGKTFLIGAIVFALCMLFPGITVIWTAHRLRTADETFASMQGFSRRKKIAPFVLRPRLGSGEQEIRFRNRSRILFGARERGFGRGFAQVDVLVFDEAQILTENAIDDMVPATNQAPNPLLLFTGTPPKPTDPGEVFTAKRDKALSGASDDMAYIEFSADSDADPNDRKQWAKANASYPKRTPANAILRMQENLTADSFLREALGIWPAVRRGDLDFEKWIASADAGAKRGKPVSFGVDIGEDRLTHIAVAWLRPDGKVQVMVSDVGLSPLATPDRLRELSKKWAGKVWLGGPSAALESEVRRSGLVTSAEFTAACGRIEDLLTGDLIRHGNQDELNEAVRTAVWRISTNGAKTFVLKDAPAIGPLAAVARAIHGLGGPAKSRVVDLAAALQEAAEAERQALVESK